jgi:hypothetical protein
MAKKILVFVVAIFLLIILTLSFVSANAFGNFFKKITGQTVSSSCLGDSCSSKNFFNKLKSIFGFEKSRIIFYSCEDYENANPQNDPTLKGYIVVNYTENNGLMRTQTVYDSCSDETSSFGSAGSKSVIEYWCKNTPSKSQPVRSVIPCDIGKHCEDGACIGELVCDDTDNGKDYILYGETTGYDPLEHRYLTYNDNCLSEDELREGYCMYTGEVDRENYLCSNGCSDTGVCIEPALTGNAFDCVDSDNGINAVMKGSATGPNAQTKQQSWIIKDICNTVSMGNGQFISVLSEAYCSSNGQLSSIDIVCPSGCGDGVCNPTNGASGCVDSDNGLETETKGVVTGSYYGLNGQSFTDSCMQKYGSYSYYIKEGYCENNVVHIKNIMCEGICIDGACVSYSNPNAGNGNSSNNENVQKEITTDKNQNNLQISINKIQSKKIVDSIPNIRYKH